MRDKMYGKHLKELREAKKLSQDQVAQELNVSRQAISKWENDKTFPDIDNLIRLSRLYGVTLDELVGVEREKEETTEKDKEEGYKREEVFYHKESIIGMLLIMIVIASCLIAQVGFIVSIIFIVLSKELRTKKWKWILRIVCLVALFVSTYNCYQILSFYFEPGEATIEYLG
ncbi:hypothetical protein B5F13_04865 [Drancourtella sp. An177]|nr:hypothetical protein B5F13_04865 [Drancourtella sp. An177]